MQITKNNSYDSFKDLWVNIPNRNSIIERVDKLKEILSHMNPTLFSPSPNEDLARLYERIRIMHHSIASFLSTIREEMRYLLAENDLPSIQQLFEHIQDFMNQNVPNTIFGYPREEGNFIYRFLQWEKSEQHPALDYEFCIDLLSASIKIENKEYTDACVKFIKDTSNQYPHLDYLLNNGDAYFVCSEGEVIPFFKNILFPLCDYARVYGDLSPKEKIHLQDMSYSTVIQGLTSLYTGSIRFILQKEQIFQFMEVYKLASKYGIPRLEKLCIDEVSSFIKEEWLWYIHVGYGDSMQYLYDLAFQYGCFEIVDQFIQRSIKGLISSKKDDHEEILIGEHVAKDWKETITSYKAPSKGSPNQNSIQRLHKNYPHISDWDFGNSLYIKHPSLATVVKLYGETIHYFALSTANQRLHNSRFFNIFSNAHILDDLGGHCPNLEELHFTHSKRVKTVFESWRPLGFSTWRPRYAPPYVINPKDAGTKELESHEDAVTLNFDYADLQYVMNRCKKIHSLTLSSNLSPHFTLHEAVDLIEDWGHNVTYFKWICYDDLPNKKFFCGKKIMKRLPQLKTLILIKYKKIEKKTWIQGSKEIKREGFIPIAKTYT